MHTSAHVGQSSCWQLCCQSRKSGKSPARVCTVPVWDQPWFVNRCSLWSASPCLLPDSGPILPACCHLSTFSILKYILLKLLQLHLQKLVNCSYYFSLLCFLVMFSLTVIIVRYQITALFLKIEKRTNIRKYWVVLLKNTKKRKMEPNSFILFIQEIASYFNKDYFL
jgi:hypothetical protein